VIVYAMAIAMATETRRQSKNREAAKPWKRLRAREVLYW
jgi:hypothetical protein